MSIGRIGGKHSPSKGIELHTASKKFGGASHKLQSIQEEASLALPKSSSKTSASRAKLSTRAIDSLQAGLTRVQKGILEVVKSALLFISKRQNPKKNLNNLVKSLKYLVDADLRKPMRTAIELRDKLATYQKKLRALQKNFKVLSCENESLVATSKGIETAFKQLNCLKLNVKGQARVSAQNIFSSTIRSLKALNQELANVKSDDEGHFPNVERLKRAQNIQIIHQELGSLTSVSISSRVLGKKIDNRQSEAIFKKYKENLHQVQLKLTAEVMRPVNLEPLRDIDSVDKQIVALQGALQALALKAD